MKVVSSLLGRDILSPQKTTSVDKHCPHLLESSRGVWQCIQDVLKRPFPLHVTAALSTPVKGAPYASAATATRRRQTHPERIYCFPLDRRKFKLGNRPRKPPRTAHVLHLVRRCLRAALPRPPTRGFQVRLCICEAPKAVSLRFDRCC